MGAGHTGSPGADGQRAGGRVHCPLLSKASWSRLRPPGPHGFCVTFWGRHRRYHIPSGCSSALLPKRLDGRDSVPTTPVGGLIPAPGFKCHPWSHAPHPNTQQVLGGVLVPLGVLPRAKEDLGPGQLPATPAAGQRGWTPYVALRWPPLPEPQPWRLWAGVARPRPRLQHGPLTSGHRPAGARRPPGPGWARSRRCPPCRWWTKWPAPRGGRGPSSSHSKRG